MPWKHLVTVAVPESHSCNPQPAVQSGTHGTSLDHDTGRFIRPRAQREIGTGHEDSDPLVQVYLPVLRDRLHPMNLTIPLYGLLSGNLSDALMQELSNGPDLTPADADGSAQEHLNSRA